MSQEIITLLMFLGVLLGVFVGFPTAFVLGGMAMVFGLLFSGPEVFGFFVVRLFGTLTNYTFLAVPLFLFMGVFMEKSGLAEKLFTALYQICGPLRGGLGISTIAIATIFAACTGVVGASEVTIGLMALPAMLEKRYDKALACGAICAGGTLGILIPPSVMIVIYGPIAGVSVGKLFMGAILPGVLLAVLYVLYIALRCYFRPQDGPPLPPEERCLRLGQKVYLLSTSILPILLLIFAVLGSIFFGVAAVTEAAGVGALASLLLAFFYRRLSLTLIREACLGTLKITSMILMIAVGASFFSTVFVSLGGDEAVSNLFLKLNLGKWGFILVINVLLVVAGMFLDWLSILFIIVPIVTPVAAKFGFDPVWFAVLVMVNLQISFLTPPFAYSIFYLRGIAPKEVATTDIYRGVVPFVALQCLGVFLCLVFPALITWLPGALVK